MSDTEEKSAEQKRIDELEAENADLREKSKPAEPEADTRSAMQKMVDGYGQNGGE